MASDETEPWENTLTFFGDVCLHMVCEGIWVVVGGSPGCWLCLLSSHALHLTREGAPLQQGFSMTTRLRVSKCWWLWAKGPLLTPRRPSPWDLESQVLGLKKDLGQLTQALQGCSLRLPPMSPKLAAGLGSPLGEACRITGPLPLTSG